MCVSCDGGCCVTIITITIIIAAAQRHHVTSPLIVRLRECMFVILAMTSRACKGLPTELNMYTPPGLLPRLRGIAID